jgi:Domain of unknown function (DUF4375)
MSLDQNEMNRRLIALAESPTNRFWRVDYEALSRPERVFRAIWELEAQVNNGGFHQFFYNTSGEIAPFVVDALRSIGASAMAEIVERALQLVSPDIPWRDYEARRARVMALGPEIEEQLDSIDQDFFKYPDNLTALLHRYVSQHRDDIGAPAEF